MAAAMGFGIGRLQLAAKAGQVARHMNLKTPLTHKPTKVLALKGSRNVPGRIRDNVSVLACVNAAGKSISPMAIVKGVIPAVLDAYNTRAGLPGMVYTYSQKEVDE